MGRLIVLLFALLLAGCATPEGGARLTMHHDQAGNMVEVLELVQDCPEAVLASPNGGCAVARPVRVIFYPQGDTNARRHELDHVAGMRHGEWRNGCAPIRAGGYTIWMPGNVMCRDRDGSYFQREP